MSESLPLTGITVIESATLAAAPIAASYLAEFGARVIKVEPPVTGDGSRQWGSTKNGIGLNWKNNNRNKEYITLDLRRPDGQDALRGMIGKADVLVQNQRPSTLESWGLDWATTSKVNSRLVNLHMTAFGRGGRDSDRPGFGTLAEAMSGFANMTGEPAGPPTLPPFPLGDGIAAIMGAYATMLALYHRDVHGGPGQYVDLSLIEPLSRICGMYDFEWAELGTVTKRFGNRWDLSVPRNAYRTKDDRWIAMSGSTQSSAFRAFRAIGHPEWAEDPELQTGAGRRAHADRIDAAITSWVAERTQAEALEVMEACEVAVGAIYDSEQKRTDPHFIERGTWVTVDDDLLGQPTVQGPVPRLSETPGVVRSLGGSQLGQDNERVLGEFLGWTPGDLVKKRAEGLV
jgi:crotonobetainyl-CoA:carnitine CoA-transferase CaiB-like acyl-CoA transferase